MREQERLLLFSRMVLFYYFWLSLRFCSFFLRIRVFFRWGILFGSGMVRDSAW